MFVKTDSASGPELVSREEKVSELSSDILCPSSKFNVFYENNLLNHTSTENRVHHAPRYTKLSVIDVISYYC